MSKPNEVTVDHILDEFREIATSSRDLGYKFECLILGYLKTDPFYKGKFSNVWLWRDWPKRNNKPDTGIDLVAQERDTGHYCAIQCKFFDPDHCLDKEDIDSFFTASGQEPFSSRMIVCTTDNWTRHAEDAIQKQQIPVIRLLRKDLADSRIDWGKLNPKYPDRIELKDKKTLLPCQKEALETVMEKFQESDRGKLIMACGTGKTFTSLKIAERFANKQRKAYVLFLVPSIALLSQTLREWSAEADVNLHSIAVCSDVKVGKKNTDSGDIDTCDLAYPATTDPDLIVQRTQASADEYDLTVVFSTYQSIQVIADAQQKGLPEFDLIICDEAHRTTGVTLQGQDESNFVGVHNQDFIQSKKRLYMTATPRLYGEATKTKAQENDATLCSMDDEELYGPEFHRLGFGEAVSRDLLTDYKVMVLAVDEKHVSTRFQYQLADENNELNLEDAVKITGCWNGLSKRMMTDANGELIKSDTNPMRSAVAFCNSINDSKKITRLFSEIVEEYQRSHPNEDILHCELDHVDGKHNSLERHQKLDWLKNDTRNQGEVCRILSNAKCLSEGVDVPALDAVMFLSPKNSMVDVVQSVGRVMRKAEGKDYGYIILPVGIPGDMSPQEALKDNKRYQVVWKVLQALRSHDDRFNAIVNQIELNEKRPSKIDVIGVGGDRGDDEDGSSGSSEPKVTQLNINFPQLEEWRDAIYGKIVSKCGDRYYWENWAKDVGKIAEGYNCHIKNLLDQDDSEAREGFNYFLSGLHQNINPNVTEDEAIEMLSQHLITKPVFDALFEQYQFTKYNPISISMQKILNRLEKESLNNKTATLEKLYDQVRERASGVDNAEGKQQIIIELYEKFFQNAFPRVSDRLGIVYTPVEVVDFILNSSDYVLQQEFGAGLSNEGVHILDPFTGTGTFIVQLLKNGLIKPKDLERKFNSELHANEIVLLAYYIAAINIEEAYHLQSGEYKPFDGIVLTDTFQMFENTGTLNEAMFPENNQRVTRQKEKPIKVVVANPPYSVGQNSENDSNQNLSYPQISNRIQESYVKYSSSTSVNSLYNSYIRAIRWASDRIEEKGIVCYVTNGSFIDGKASDGLRRCLVDEFTSVYCFNLRGNARTSGEQRRKEKGNVFDEGTRDPIAITLLIKNPNKEKDNCVYYYDIGDYLSQEQKLDKISELDSVANIFWEKITPNAKYDWINKRDPAFDKFIPLGNKRDKTIKTIFDLYSRGVQTGRDYWVYNFSNQILINNVTEMISFYNEQVEKYKKHVKKIIN